MQHRTLRQFALVLLVLGLASCSGGGKAGGTPTSCDDPGAFCLQTCNLGCGPAGGCSLNEIALNQPLQFVFSQAVDPRTVNFTTLSLKTRAGTEPTGQWFSDGQVVQFLPEVQTIQGQTFFGFTPNEEYVLTILGAEAASNTLRSTSGDQLVESFTCTLRSSLGIVDLDQAPPRATLVSPTTTQDVPRDANIVLEFSEFIDGAPFFDPPEGEEPIRFVLQAVGRDQNNNPLCSGQEILLAGTPRLANDPIRGRTVVTFRPVDQLPGNRCLKIEITPRVVDLSGTSAVTTSFELFLEEVDVEEREVAFDFDSDQFIDTVRSGGRFGGGTAEFVTLGGDGRHGDFNAGEGQSLGGGRFLFNTDFTAIPAKPTSFMGGDQVRDGHYYFTNFVVPNGATVEFRGSKPARLFVRGMCRIEGRLVVNAPTVPNDHDGRADFVTALPYAGQEGGLPGAGGASGGDGAFACDGLGNPNQPQFNNYNGYDGDDVVVPAGHAYEAQAVGTGGGGGLLFPSHGDRTMLIYRGFGGTFAIEAAAGAGGGGYRTVGSPGRIEEAGSITGDPPNMNAAEMGPPGPGGLAFDPFPKPAGVASSDHFLIGGSGGGGGASHPTFANLNIIQDPVKYRSGAAGAGGGGALNLRIGNGLFVASGAAIESRGGTAVPTTTGSGVGTRGVPAPGGAGSGGSILLQVIGSVNQNGTLDVRGGEEVRVDFQDFFRLKTFGGAGGDGYFRLERPADEQPSDPLPQLGVTMPAATPQNVGDVEESDDRVGFMSVFRDTGEPFAPTFLRYEIDAVVDGSDVVFSDDPDVGIPALEGSSALIFYVQGAELDPSTGQPVDVTAIAEWRRYVGPFSSEGGLFQDGKTALRWQLILDRTMSTDVVVRQVKVVYEI